MPKRILLADDNQTIRKVIAELLQSNGFTVCAEAVDGEDAVTKAVELRPDLIVIDLVMPSMNGLAASAKISELVPGVPIILHTLHATSNLEVEAKRNGISRVVPKSDGHSILSHIQNLLGSDGSSNASTSYDSAGHDSVPPTTRIVEHTAQVAEPTVPQRKTSLPKAS